MSRYRKPDGAAPPRLQGMTANTSILWADRVPTWAADEDAHTIAVADLRIMMDRRGVPVARWRDGALPDPTASPTRSRSAPHR